MQKYDSMERKYRARMQGIQVRYSPMFNEKGLISTNQTENMAC